MKLAVATLTLALLGASPAVAQDGTAAPDKGSTATPPRDAKPGETGQSGVSVGTPRVDPKLIIDVFKHLTKPRPRPAPPVLAPTAVEPTDVAPAKPVAANPVPVQPAVAPPPPPPRAVPAADPAAAAPVVKPRPSPPPAAKPPPTPIAVAEPAPVEPVIAGPAEPVPPTRTVSTVSETSAPASAPSPAAQRNASLLSQSPWLLLALLAAAAAIAAAIAWSRARQVGRTRAALSLDPRLDLDEGTSSAGGLALACPPMSIRTRLDFA